MKINFSEHAVRQLDDIFDFLSQKNESAAIRTYNDVLDRIEKLLSFPQMAAIEPLLVDEPENYRSLVVNNQYKVIYHTDDTNLNIVDVWDCRRDPAYLQKHIKGQK